MDALEASESEETKKVFISELLDYLATHPEADLSLLGEMFKSVQENIVKANNELKGNGDDRDET